MEPLQNIFRSRGCGLINHIAYQNPFRLCQVALLAVSIRGMAWAHSRMHRRGDNHSRLCRCARQAVPTRGMEWPDGTADTDNLFSICRGAQRPWHVVDPTHATTEPAFFFLLTLCRAAWLQLATHSKSYVHVHDSTDVGQFSKIMSRDIPP